MMIRNMTATFGKLQQQSLFLKPGLNVISGSNEAGKTTWAEFLLAMLYGVDTRSRGKNGQLPIRARYAPWDGTAMAGSLEVEQNGTRIQIERRSEAGPLSVFSARESDSGCPVSGMTADNCGALLIGAGREVYQRSGFLRQRQLAIASDAQLEKRLNSLVTAGAEDYSYADTDAKLKKLQTAIRHNQTGALPRAEAELAEIETRIDTLLALHEKQAELQARLRRSAEEIRDSEGILAGLDALDRSELCNALQAAEAQLQQAAEDRSAWETICGELPPEEALQNLELRLQLLQQQTQAAATEASLDPLTIPEPPEENLFHSTNPKQIEEIAAKDAERVRNLRQPSPSGGWALILTLIPALLLLAAGLALLLPVSLPDWIPVSAIPMPDLIGGFLCALGAIIALLAILRRVRLRKSVRQRSAEASAILTQYRVDSPEELLKYGAVCKRQAELYREQKLQAAQLAEQRNQQARVLMDKQAALVRQAQSLMPTCDSLRKAAALIQDAAQSRRALELADRTQSEARQLVDALRQQLGPDAEAPAGDFSQFRDYDRAAVLEQKEIQTKAHAALQSEADRLTGAIQQAGDLMALEAEREACRQRISALNNRYQAIALARASLEQADRELRSRFAPLLCKTAGDLFARLTGGKYDRIELDRELSVSVHPTGSAVTRPVAYLSTGAQDLLYFAIRISICDLVIPEAPIVMDDALVYLDDDRARQVLQVLRKLGKNRQILLFTCHSREKRLLDEPANA